MATVVHANAATPKRASKMASSQSLNHLLNFSLPPRAHVQQSIPRRSRKTGNQTVWNKERFVNAQYRFVMSPAGDYTVHFADPDIFFQWEDILQVIIPRTSALASAAGGDSLHQATGEGLTTCPICLSPPTAPRMTKCGHVFCFPCILHYLSTSDNLKWMRCPICFDSVHEKQLKSVKWFDEPIYPDEESEGPPRAGSSSGSLTSRPDGIPKEGSTMKMRLMQRPQITTLALPRSHTWPSDLLPPHQAPFHFLPDVENFAKFMLATPTYLISDLTRDLDELSGERRVMAGMGDSLELIYIETAEAKVKSQIEKAASLETPHLRDAVEKALRDQQEIEARVSRQQRRRKEEENARTPAVDVPQEFLASKAVVSPAEPQSHGHGGGTTRHQRQRRNLNPPPPSTSTYFYYQAASGLPIFLHPLDIKILLSHFISYTSFPDTITVRVDSFAEGTVNDDLRKRCKYLGHFAEGADVVFVEADLDLVVGEAGLRNFEGALKTRKARKRDKGRKDDRAKAKAEERDKEKERENLEWRTVGSTPRYERPSSPGWEELPPHLLDPTPAQQASFVSPVVVEPPTSTWGVPSTQRSFASAALRAAPPAGSTIRPTASDPSARRPLRDEDEDWDVEGAWHELESRGDGRKKRVNKLVVLGGGGGRRR